MSEKEKKDEEISQTTTIDYFDRFMDEGGREDPRQVGGREGVEYPKAGGSVHKKTVDRFYNQHNESIKNLVQVRKAWDVFVVQPGTPGGTRIPNQDLETGSL